MDDVLVNNPGRLNAGPEPGVGAPVVIVDRKRAVAAAATSDATASSAEGVAILDLVSGLRGGPT